MAVFTEKLNSSPPDLSGCIHFSSRHIAYCNFNELGLLDWSKKEMMQLRWNSKFLLFKFSENLLTLSKSILCSLSLPWADTILFKGMKVIGMEHCIRNRMMLTFRFSIKFWQCLSNRHAWQILPEELSTLMRKNIVCDCMHYASKSVLLKLG